MHDLSLYVYTVSEITTGKPPAGVESFMHRTYLAIQWNWHCLHKIERFNRFFFSLSPLFGWSSQKNVFSLEPLEYLAVFLYVIIFASSRKWSKIFFSVVVSFKQVFFNAMLHFSSGFSAKSKFFNTFLDAVQHFWLIAL